MARQRLPTDNDLLRTLQSIHGKIRRYASLISAADRFENLDFEPEFRRCIDEVHERVSTLPADFRQQHQALVRLLLKDGYHFGWSEIDDRLGELIPDQNL